MKVSIRVSQVMNQSHLTRESSLQSLCVGAPEKFYCDNLYNLDGNNFDKFHIGGVGIDDYPSIVAWGEKLG